MDFIDRLALLFEGKSPKSPIVDPQRENSSEDSLCDLPNEDVEIEDLTIIDSFEDDVEVKPIADDQQRVLSDFSQINLHRESLGDMFLQKDHVVSFNDLIAKSDITQSRPKKDYREKSAFFNIFPYINYKMDFGSWVYKNRYGVIGTMIIYIMVLSSIMFVNFNIKGSDLSNSIIIEVPLDEPPVVPEEKRKPTDLGSDYSDAKVENIAVDKNASLDSKLKDDRNTKTDDLYKEASRLQSSMDASRSEYEKGLEAISDIKREDKKSVNPLSGKDNSINKQGNVTVSYDLKNRYVTRPEIPAYRCKGSGKAVIDVVVGKNGRVLSASLRSIQGVNDDCVPQMALEAAKLTEFNIDYNAPEKQSGVISFVFVAQ